MISVWGVSLEEKGNCLVESSDFWKVLRKYRVQLNLMRPHNLDSHNMRSIEVPAVGGIGLFPDTPDHERFFEKGNPG